MRWRGRELDIHLFANAKKNELINASYSWLPLWAPQLQLYHPLINEIELRDCSSIMSVCLRDKDKFLLAISGSGQYIKHC